MPTTDTSAIYTHFKPGSTFFRLLTAGPFTRDQLCDIFQCLDSEIPLHIAAIAPHGIRHSEHGGLIRFDFVRPALQRTDPTPRVKAFSQLGRILQALPGDSRKLAKASGLTLDRMGAAISGLKKRGFPIYRLDTKLFTPFRLPPGTLETRGDYLHFITDDPLFDPFKTEEKRAAGFLPPDENNLPEGQEST